MNSNHNRLSYRFPFWLTVIFLLLIVIPISILTNQLVVAKFSGILCLLIVVFAMRYWFRVAKQNAGRRDRVILNNNDWFDLQRAYPSVTNWSKGDVTILKDRIGLLLANVEFRKNKNELSSREEAIQQAFQWCVFYWQNESQVFNDSYLYIDGQNQHVQCSVLTNEIIVKLSLGFDKSFSKVEDLQLHYQAINPVQD